MIQLETHLIVLQAIYYSGGQPRQPYKKKKGSCKTNAGTFISIYLNGSNFIYLLAVNLMVKSNSS